MINITIIEHNDTEHTLQADTDQSVMQAVTAEGIPGLPADCGGACACATCHVYVDPAWVDKFPPAEELEQDMLECVIQLESNSRLSCQLQLTKDVDGLIVRLPEAQ